MPLRLFSKHHSLFHTDLWLYYKYHLNEQAALYLTHTIKSLSVSLVGIFLPIYIFDLSDSYLFFHSVPLANGIIWVLAYYFLRSFGVIVFTSLLAGFIFSKIRFGRSIAISLIIQIIEVALWLVAKNNLYLILLAGFLAGFKVTLYWIPYHIFFVEKFKSIDGHYGRAVGFRDFLVKVVTGLAPLVGGIIIFLFGFDVLFIISMFLLVSAVLPIFVSVHEWTHHEHKILHVIKDYCFNSRLKLISFAYAGQGAEVAVFQVFWPILLFIVLVNSVKIGFITSLSFLLSCIVVLAVGKALDRHGSKVIHAIGICINSLLHIVRIFSCTPLSVYAIDIADRINTPLASLPNMSLSYEKAKKLNMSDFILYRELVLHTSIAFSTGLLILIVPSLGNWKLVFALAAVASLFSYFLDLDQT